MADEMQNILEAARKLGDEVAKHPALDKYQKAQQALADDPEASRLLKDFDSHLERVLMAEQTGQAVDPSVRQTLEALQSRLASNLKVKNFSIAQADLSDMLRKVSQAWQRPVAEAQGAGQPQQSPAGMGAMGGMGSSLVM
ncbi:MAG: YlbF family regulator [Phycisphaerae bacterium]